MQIEEFKRWCDLPYVQGGIDNSMLETKMLFNV